MDRVCPSDPGFVRLEQSLRAEIGDDVRSQIEPHLAACDVCRAERAAILADRRLLSAGLHEPPTIHEARAHDIVHQVQVGGSSSRWRLVLLAAPLAALVGVAFFVESLSLDDPADQPRATTLTAVPYTPPQVQTALPAPSDVELEVIAAQGMERPSVRADEPIVVPASAELVVGLDTGTKISLRGEATIEGHEGRVQVRLDRGEVECAVEHLRSGESFQVQTDDLEAWVVGTRFIVRAAPEGSQVYVLEGRVWVRHREDRRAIGDGPREVLEAAPPPAGVVPSSLLGPLEAPTARPVVAAPAADLLGDARRALAARDYEQAKTLLGRHLAGRPADDDARYLLGEAQRLGGDPDAATRTFEALASGRGRTAENALARLAFLAERQGPDAAVAAWDRYLAAHPRGTVAAEGTIRRANTLFSLGRRAEARAALERFLVDFPDHPRRAEVEERLHAAP